MIGEISLEGIEFFAYHGFYAEERKIGNKYEVDIKIKVDIETSAATDDLSKTVDYEQVYKIIKTEIDTPAKLLEKLATKIVDNLFLTFSQVLAIEVSVSKFNPPIGGVCERARVKILKAR